MKNPLEIAEATRQGYGVICATCDRLTEDPKRLISEGVHMRRCHETTCGGPFSGRDFPRYKGPITDFSRWCFVCGEASKYGATAPETTRKFGLCEEHVSMLSTVRAVDKGLAVVTDVVDPRQGLISIENLLGRPRKTLGQAIAEAEADFTEKGL